MDGPEDGTPGPHAPPQARPGSAGSRPSRHPPASRPPTILGTVSKAQLLCQLRRCPSYRGRCGRRWCLREVSPRAPSRFLTRSAVQLTPPPPRRPRHQRNKGADLRGLAAAPRPPEPSPAKALWVLLPVCQDWEEGRRKGRNGPLGTKSRQGGRERDRRVGIDLRAALWPSPRSHWARQGAARGAPGGDGGTPAAGRGRQALA